LEGRESPSLFGKREPRLGDWEKFKKEKKKKLILRERKDENASIAWAANQR